jgi:ATP-dependent RNA helicase DDX19/DBP5
MSSTEPTKEPAQETAADSTDASLAQAQADGAGGSGKGGALAEVEYKVEVKLADMQADPNNPLYSAKSFEELKLQV